ncbi:DUF3027 domain-containing protein [Amycolatopsis sp. NPDC004625]|uniref:DUF3027 domain-containing protein n=1 Tax=Amycolatopsis sp. NPDC004625 TaxID=3154670 RepID=UPI0033A50F86
MTLLLTLDDGSVQRKLADAVEFARAAVLEDAPEEQLGTHVGVTREDAVTASHLFEAQVPGYGGWRWSVTVALAGDDEPVTVSEVVLVPGPSALVAPAWVPWERRVRPGDLGVGDIFPTDENDPRLAPAYLQSDDPSVEETARDAGLGRVHVLSRFGRTDAAARWHAGEFGPRSDMARSAPDVCGTCGFFVPLAGSLRGVFGVCSNDIAPADGHVVDVEYGCGAHSEVEVEVTSSIPVAELVYDDSLLDFAPAPGEAVETPAAEGETGVAESDVSPADVEPEVAEVGERAEGAVAEPVEADAAEARTTSEPVVAEVPEPAAAEPAQAEATDAVEVRAVPEPAETEPEQGAVADVAEVRTAPEPVVAEVPEPAEAEPAQAEVTDAAVVGAASEPVESSVVAEAESAQADAAEVRATSEPVVAEVPESAAVEPADAAEVIGAVAPETASEPAEGLMPEGSEGAAAGSEVAEQDSAPEPTQAEATDVSDPASVPEPAEGEPTQAEVTDAIAPVAGEVQGDETRAPLDADR